MKKQLFSSIAATIAFVTISLGAGAPPSGSFDPVIEITNKSNQNIQANITDETSGKDITTAYISPNQRWNSGTRVIDMNNTLRIEVTTQKASTGFKQGTRETFIINAPGKTKYLSWNPEKSMPLYPQTGPLAGFGKIVGMKNESGYSLSNNVLIGQIRQIKAK